MFMNQIRSFALLRPSAFSSFAFAACVVLSCGLSVNAQNPGSSHDIPGEGSNTIQGRIYLPAGQTLAGSAFKVRLESSNVFSTPSTVTDQDGAFRFNSLPPGDYTVVVDGGKEYETSREPVNLDRSGGVRAVTVAVQMRLKANSSNPAFANVPAPARELFQQALENSRAGNHAKAIEQLKSVISQAPRFALVYNELAVQYLKTSRETQAVETLKEGLGISPEDFTLRLNYGIALLNQKKFAAAENELRLAIKNTNADSPVCRFYLAMALLDQNKFDEAQSEFENAIKNGGDKLALAHKYLGGIYWRNKKYREAADELEKYLTLDPNAADARKIRGTIEEFRHKS